MQTYCSDKKLGEALESCHGSLSGELSLPAAVMRHRPKLAGEVTWHETERDEAIEIVVPLSVIEKLGKFVSAGQLAAVTSEYSAPVTHIARLVPAELCTSQMLSPEACQAFEIDEATCLTASGQEVALLSPMLAFNLGLPYFVSELTHGSGTTRAHQAHYVATIVHWDCNMPHPRPMQLAFVATLCIHSACVAHTALVLDVTTVKCLYWLECFLRRPRLPLPSKE